MLVGGSWGDTELTYVDGYSGYLTRHFAVGPGGELDPSGRDFDVADAFLVTMAFLSYHVRLLCEIDQLSRELGPRITRLACSATTLPPTALPKELPSIGV